MLSNFLLQWSTLIIFISILSNGVWATEEGVEDKENGPLLLDLPGCKIPEAPLFPTEIFRDWNKTFRSDCPELDPIAIVSDDHILEFTPMAQSKYESCCLKEITRPNYLVKDSYIFSTCKDLDLTKSLDTSTMEYFVLNCTSTDGGGHKMEFHYNILKTDPEVKRKLKFWKKQEQDTHPYNIMFAIIDSVSRTHARRSIPKTLKYLKSSLKFLDFKGYHCVGEPSSTNYIPMSIGITFDDLEVKRGTMKGKYDNEPFISKNFSDSNYITMYHEDLPAYNVFSFNGRTGFIYKPFDFYTRPYILVHEKYAPRQGRPTLTCVHGKNTWDFLLDYTVEFYEKVPNVPKYTTVFSTWPSHDSLPGAQLLDKSLIRYFKKLKSNGVLENTIIFFMADHGFRFAQKWAETKYGLLERNLPLFMTHFPPSFGERYGIKYMEQLKKNQDRLTSHLDLFKTLAQLHKVMTTKENSKAKEGKGGYGYNMKYGMSLLEEIPSDRTCEEANVPPKFCSCNYPLFDNETFDYEKYKKPLIG